MGKSAKEGRRRAGPHLNPARHPSGSTDRPIARGYVCQQYGLDFPEKVLTFVGVDTSPFGLSYYSRSDRLWVRQVE